MNVSCLRSRIFLASLGLVALVSCSVSNSGDPVAGRAYLITGDEDGPAVTLTFDDGVASYVSNCNTDWADYEVSSGRLKLSSERVTTIACEESRLMDRLREILTANPKLSVTEAGELVLEHGTESLMGTPTSV